MTITGLINERKIAIDNATPQNIYDFLLLAIKEQLPFGFQRKNGSIIYHDNLRVNADFPLRDGIVITTHYYIENPAGIIVHDSPKLDFMNFKVVQISNDRVILYGGCSDHKEGKQEFEKLWQVISDTYTRKEHTLQNDLPGYVHPGLLAFRQSMRLAEIEDEKKYLEELRELQQQRSSMMRQEANTLLMEGALRSVRRDRASAAQVDTGEHKKDGKVFLRHKSIWKEIGFYYRSGEYKTAREGVEHMKKKHAKFKMSEKTFDKIVKSGLSGKFD